MPTTTSTTMTTAARSAAIPLDLREHRIGVLHGGDSPEREGSLISGQAAAATLADQGYTVELIDTAKTEFVEIAACVDVALLALHGPGGEDGKMQGLLDCLGIPYTGSGVLASALAMHKPSFKQAIAAARIDTPAHLQIQATWSPGQQANRIIAELGLPAVLKPASGGGSLSTTIAREPADLIERLERLDDGDYGEFMAEEYLPGASITIGLLQVDGDLMHLPPLEICACAVCGGSSSAENRSSPRLTETVSTSPQQLAGLLASGLVPGYQRHRHTHRPGQRRDDPDLPDQPPVQPDVLDLTAHPRVRQHPTRVRTSPRVIAHQQRCRTRPIQALPHPQRPVPPPDHPTPRINQIQPQIPRLRVRVVDHHIHRARLERCTHRSVGVTRHELLATRIPRPAWPHVIGIGQPGHALHVH